MPISKKQGETKFKERVLKDLKSLPSTWMIKTQERSRRGTPDILACVNGWFVALELKVESGKLDLLQQHNIGEIARCGGISAEVKPSTWAEQFRELQNLAVAKTYYGK